MFTHSFTQLFSYLMSLYNVSSTMTGRVDTNKNCSGPKRDLSYLQSLQKKIHCTKKGFRIQKGINTQL